SRFASHGTPTRSAGEGAPETAACRTRAQPRSLLVNRIAFDQMSFDFVWRQRGKPDHLTTREDCRQKHCWPRSDQNQVRCFGWFFENLQERVCRVIVELVSLID